MSEQAKILEDLQELIMEILKSGSASAEQGNKLDKLEAQLFKQRSFKKSTHEDYDIQGEEIAGLFVNDSYSQAIDKLYEYKITSNDFFGFVQYHFDEDDDSELLEVFSDAFIAKVNKDYEVKCESK
ncbi:MAG: hypothetical protein COA44_08070 [Arcobacter sp.]|nr:MAG: hypothetical protein COA44_08070 [Arcobacter sp.]